MSLHRPALAPPLIFVRPVGFDPATALRLIEAAEAHAHTARWRLSPPGLSPDAYIAPQGALGLPMVGMSGDAGDTLPDPSMLPLDEQGWYRGRPVCVVHGLEPHAPPELADMAILDDLAYGLRLLGVQLGRTRVHYQLGGQLWRAQRGHVPGLFEWKTRGQLLAAADTSSGRVWLMPGLEPQQMEACAMHSSANPPGPACLGFEELPLEWFLWSFSQRCDENLLAQMLPPDYLQRRWAPYRATLLGARQMGRQGTAALKLTALQARTGAELGALLGLSEAGLRRLLAGLLLTRTLRASRSRPRQTGLRHWLGSWWGRNPAGEDGAKPV